MKTRTVNDKVEFKTTPHEVYEALMDEKIHSKFTESEAKISRRVGGKFEVYGGGINGKNIELVPDKKIVQEWYCQTNGWPEGHYSRLTITLKKTPKGTVLEMVHSDVPEDAYDDILDGWKRYYWEPMKKMLEKKKTAKKS